MDRKWKFCCLGTLMAMLAGTVVAAPGVQAESLEAASLQLGALQAQAQYAPSALQGARAASRSAASCLVTAVQYTHGQQIWRADPCEFCLCLDGEMFCWWQECPPAAPGPCPSGQPYSLCGNSSTSLDQHPPPPPPIHKIKRTQYKKATTTTTTTTVSPSATTSITSTPESESKSTGGEEEKKPKSKEKASAKADKKKKLGVKQRRKEEASSNYTTVESGVYETQTETFEGTKEPSKGSSPSLEASNNATESSRAGCLVMGIEYQIGQTLPSTGSCLVCRCSEGGSSGARVSCAPRGCAPMDAAALTDDPESF